MEKEYNTPVISKEISELFKKGINKSVFDILEILTIKSQEYWRNDNPFHNFETGARITGTYPEKVLYGFLLKHLVSLQDVINDLPTKRVDESLVKEKIADIVIYMLVLKELIYYNHSYAHYGE